MLAVVVLALALQTPTDADPAAGAAMAMGECLQSFAASPSKAAFVKLEGDLGRAIAADPAMGKLGFSVDDAGGRGCRVTYTGDKSKATRLAEAYPKLAAGCPQQAVDSQGVTCPVGSGSPPFRLEVRQAPAASGQGVVVATLVDLRP